MSKAAELSKSCYLSEDTIDYGLMQIKLFYFIYPTWVIYLDYDYSTVFSILSSPDI